MLTACAPCQPPGGRRCACPGSARRCRGSAPVEDGVVGQDDDHVEGPRRLGCQVRVARVVDVRVGHRDIGAVLAEQRTTSRAGDSRVSDTLGL